MMIFNLYARIATDDEKNALDWENAARWQKHAFLPKGYFDNNPSVQANKDAFDKAAGLSNGGGNSPAEVPQTLLTQHILRPVWGDMKLVSDDIQQLRNDRASSNVKYGGVVIVAVGQKNELFFLESNDLNRGRSVIYGGKFDGKDYDDQKREFLEETAGIFEERGERNVITIYS